MTQQRPGQLDWAHLPVAAYLSPCRAKTLEKTPMVHFEGSLQAGSEQKMALWTTWLAYTANVLTALHSYPQG
jgi:hypothetical protein